MESQKRIDTQRVSLSAIDRNVDASCDLNLQTGTACFFLFSKKIDLMTS
jgi:hypothetical protein